MRKKARDIKMFPVIFYSMLLILTFSATASRAENKSNGIVKMSASVLQPRTIISSREPTLTLMVSQGSTDRMLMAWTPGSDGETPQELTKYEVHLSTEKDFQPDQSTLKKTVKRWTQTEITDLEPGTRYYGKVVAVYDFTNTVSSSSDMLFGETATSEVVVRQDVKMVTTDQLGLGEHTVGIDGTTYTYSKGTAPKPEEVLFSDDKDGGITLRKVKTATKNPDGTVTVETSDAALSDVLREAEVNSSLNLINLDRATADPHSVIFGVQKSSIRNDGSRVTTMQWRDNLLTIEQKDFTYQEEDYSFTPQGDNKFLMEMHPEEATATQKMSIDLEAGFEPSLTTDINIGWGIFTPKLKSAELSATGKLYMKAVATYNFEAAASVEKEVKFFEKTYTTVFSVGPVPVYQEVILTLHGKFSASADAQIKAQAMGKLSQELTVGIRFDGDNWKPFVENNRETDASLTLDVAGKATAEVRLIPKVEVKYYKVVGGYMTIEPFIQSDFEMETVTSNAFILGELALEGVSPLNLKELHSFIGLQCNVGLTLPSIIEKIGGDAFGPECIFGTKGSGCQLTPLSRYYLFEVPILSLMRDGGNNLTLTAVDGKLSPVTPNRFDLSSVHWYVVPNSSSISDSASITPTGCSKSGSKTTCTATFSPGSGAAEDYTVFASGHGDLGLAARQFKKITITPPGPATEIRVTNGGKWGTWRDTFMCPDFQYVTGISLKVEGSQGGDDDTALNNIRLHCSDGSTVVESNEAHDWGTWGDPEQCPSGRYMTGFKLKVEADQGSGDDTAANSIAGVCDDKQTITPTNGGSWGEWGSAVSCPSGKKVCGAQLKIEPHVSDDSAVNDVLLYCCD